MKPLHDLTIAEASVLIQSGELSSATLVEAFLARTEAVDPVIHSYITLCADDALAAANLADTEIAAGHYRGLLHGIPYGLKDNYHVPGVRTTAGSRLMLDYMPDRQATLDRKMQEAGAVRLGKLNTWEYGTGNGAVYFDLPFPPARNPWDPERFTGGSSTGPGAALAAGTAMCALATDTGGSIRLPAAACGQVGLKATFGRISRAGILPNCWTLDHSGPIARSVEDAAILLQALAGHDPADPGTVAMPVPDYWHGLRQGVAGLRIGVVRRLYRDVDSDPALVEAFESSVEIFRSLGAELVEVPFDYALQEFRTCARVINACESLSIHEEDFEQRRAEMGRALREKLFSAVEVSAADYLRAMRWRREISEAIERSIAPLDALLCAGSTVVPPRFDEPDKVVAFTALSAMSPFNLSGHPALSICNGFTPEGVPLNMQIVANHWDEATLLRVAAAYEAATDWSERRPSLLETR